MPNKVYPSPNPQGTLAERIRCWQLGTDADLPGASTDLSTRRTAALLIPAAHLSNIECPDIFGNAVTEF